MGWGGGHSPGAGPGAGARAGMGGRGEGGRVGGGGAPGRAHPRGAVALGVAAGAAATLLLVVLGRRGGQGGLALRAQFLQGGAGGGADGGAAAEAEARVQASMRAHSEREASGSSPGEPRARGEAEAKQTPPLPRAAPAAAPAKRGKGAGVEAGSPAPGAEGAACAHGGRRRPDGGGGTGGGCLCHPLFEGPRCESPTLPDVAEKLQEGVVWEMGMKKMKMHDIWSNRAPGTKQPSTERYLENCALVADAGALVSGEGDPLGTEIDKHEVVVRLAGDAPRGGGGAPKRGLDLVRHSLVRGGEARVGKRTTHIVVPPSWAEGLIAANTTEEPGLGPRSIRFLLFPYPSDPGADKIPVSAAQERLSHLDRAETLEVAGRSVVDHVVALRRRLRDNLGQLDEAVAGAERPAAADQVPGLDFLALVYLSEVCGRVTVFGLSPEALGPADRAATPAAPSLPLRDPLTATAALLAQVGTGRVKIRLPDGWKDPHAPLPVYTMYSPKYRYYWENLETSFSRRGGAGWALQAFQMEDQAVNHGEGNKMKGNTFKIDLILKELKGRIGAVHPGFCWMDTTALVVNPLLWRPLDGKDMHFVGESRFGNPEQLVNICFMCIRANVRTLAFFEAVRKGIAEEGAWDQGRVNELIKAKQPPVSWGWLPPSTVQVLAAPHDNCDPTRSAAVLKFISMATKDHIIPGEKRMQLYNLHFNAIKESKPLKCPSKLRNRADKEFKKVRGYWEAALKKKAREAQEAEKKKAREAQEAEGRQRQAEKREKRRRAEEEAAAAVTAGAGAGARAGAGAVGRVTAGAAPPRGPPGPSTAS